MTNKATDSGTERAAESGYVIWVDFELHPEQLSRFTALVRANAKASLEHEPGCRRFDVLTPEPARAAVSLYEIYDSEQAFQLHLASDHYKTFAQAVADCVRDKQVRAFRL